MALVTGASRGIGAAIAATLARDGARVVGLDVPQAAEELRKVTAEIGGEALVLDITGADAPQRIAEHFAAGIDIVVHNAGVTRDRTIAKMPEERWSELMEINLSAEERINDALLAGGLLATNGRIVCVSSMSGIAGNAGQTNYATSKAGVIGMVEALAPELAKRGATINAVAPGFIETQMTAAMPIGPREAGRRMNSLAKAGCRSTSPRRSPGSRAPLRPGSAATSCESAGRACWGPEVGARRLDGPPGIRRCMRARVAMIPGASRLPFVPGGGERSPICELTLAGCGRPETVAAYARVCGFTLRDHLPPTYPHVLAFGLQMAVMADGSFPFGAVGLIVHIENRIVQHRRIGDGEER